MRNAHRTLIFLLISTVSLLGCAADPSRELERVAKDWSLTIRASQVLPVYPLTEDLEPGDVFLVVTPLKDQVRIYKEKGFLPLDQLVTRLHQAEAYKTFYKGSYWKGQYDKVPHTRPIPGEEGKIVDAPRAAFPSYDFRVKKGGGLQLAIPVQGIPLGLGIMGASEAAGTITISDAYTYGLHAEWLAREVYHWWNKNPETRSVFMSIVRHSEEALYLRIVTRVYLTKSVQVSLRNLDAVSAGVDVAAAPELKLIDLAAEKPDDVDRSIKAYESAYAAINKQLQSVGAPGGSARFVQASRRSVTMNEPFDRPLVIGYRGFDVKVLKSGQLSVPIPSFSLLDGQADEASLLQPLEFTEDPSGLSDKYSEWVTDPKNRSAVAQWLKDNRPGLSVTPEDLPWNEEFRSLLEQLNTAFQFSP